MKRGLYGKEKGKMCTEIRAEISRQSRYWISKHRYYELKHFCLQYKDWKDLYNKLKGEPSHLSYSEMPRKADISNPTEKVAIAKAEYAYNMKMVEDIAKQTDTELSDYIFKAVTNGYSYNVMFMQYHIPCCKDTFYDRYRKFFWLLSSARR